MTFAKHEAEFYVPDGVSPEMAMERATIVAIGSHPDDLEVMALPGILEGLRRGGKQFLGVVVTRGGGEVRTGSYAGLTYEEIREIRRTEQRQAADLGNYAGVVQLMYESREAKDLTEDRPEHDLQAVLERTRPDWVLMHQPFDRHDTHAAVCMRTIRALRAATAATGWMPKKVYGCEVWRGLDWLVHHDRIALPVHDADGLSDRLIRTYKSQYAHDKQYEAALRGRRIVNATHQEAQALGTTHEVEYVVDLKPLLLEPSLDVAAFARSLVRHFEQDIMARIEHFHPLGG